MVTLDETAQALEGIWRIAIFDRAGVASFGKDLRACARSFWAYAVALPATLLLIALWVVEDKPADPILLAASHLIGEVVKIVGVPLLLVPLLRWYGRREQWAWLVTAINWLSAVQSIAFVTLIGVTWDMPGEYRSILQIVLLIYWCTLEGFLAEIVLNVGALRAGLIIALDFVFSGGIDRLADWIGGVS